MLRALFLGSILCGSPLVANAMPIPEKESSAQPYEAVDFSYLLDKTSFNKDLLKMHFTLYQGYVKNTNNLFTQLTNLSQQGQARSYEYGALKRRLGWEFDGMRLHELFFQNLGGSGTVDMSSPLVKEITKQFGSFESWKNDFVASGLIRGIGWVILYRDPNNGRLTNTWINEHDTGHFATAKPILVMDMWEHAYITQFGLDKEKYIQTFFDNIDWEVINTRFEAKY